MNSGKELQSQSQLISTQILDEPESQGHFSDLNANIVIIVLAVVPFIPAFLDVDFYDPIGRFIFSIILGCSYGLLGLRERIQLLEREIQFRSGSAKGFAILNSRS